MKESISEKYRKYLIRIKIKNQTFYSVWGTDMTSVDEKDFLLVKDSRICLFENSKLIYSYVKKLEESELIDSQNFSNWINRFTFNKVYASYNIEKMSIKKFEQLLSKGKVLSIINNINIITDFAQQTSNKELLKIRKKRHLKILWNSIYDNFFWSKKEENKFEYLLKSIEDYNILVEKFIENSTIVIS